MKLYDPFPPKIKTCLLAGLLLLCLKGSIVAQQQLWGKVVTAGSKQPIVGASVFFSNSTTGTVSDAAGRFTINTTPNNYTQLIISCIGFETVTQNIGHQKGTDSMLIVLKPKIEELNNVVVEPYEVDGWDRWGQVFTSGFIGTMYLANDCKLLNPGDIEFRYYKKKRLLLAVAGNKLEIENRSLGYTIHYQLEKFELDLNARSLFFIGYPLFEEMKGNERKQRNWQKNREQVYLGSMMHFVRSLFAGRLQENGFELHHLKRVFNQEKKRVADLLAAKAQVPPPIHYTKKGIEKDTAAIRRLKDSADYYAKVMEQPNASDVVDSNRLAAANISYRIDSMAKGFTFKDYLQVIYTKAKEPWEYNHVSPSGWQTSLLFLRSPAISIFANGAYTNSEALFMLGFWGWNEKMATLLPLDYRPL